MKKHRTTENKSQLLLIMIMALLIGAVTAAYGTEGAAAQTRSGAWDGSVDISWYTEAADSAEALAEVRDFYIDTPSQLAGLAYIVNGRLDMEVFPLKYKANTKGKGLYKAVAGKDAKGNNTTFYIFSQNKKGKFNGDTDVDAAATLAAKINGHEAMIDGTEDDGATRSGLTAEDFWVDEPTYLQLTGGGGGNTWDQIYIGYQKYDFMGQTVHIRADLDMGGTFEASGNDGVWTGPDWTPIGGKYSMDCTVTNQFSKYDIVTIDSAFNGILDGGGHTISHMYCDRTTNKGFEYSQGVALVGQIGELYNDEERGYGHAESAETADEGWIPTIRNLSIGHAGSSDVSFKGYIYGRRMVGGVAGLIGAIDNGVLVENCANFATIESTDSKGVGGVVGSGWGRGTGTIRNCYNRGNVTAHYSECPAGGISGSNSMNIYNCYNTGQIVNTAASGTEIRASGIGRHDSGTYTVDNCYSLEGSFQDTGNDGYWKGTSTTVIANVYVRQKQSSENGAGLLEDAFLSELNANAGDIFVKDSKNINNGYPILFWQASDYAGKSAVTVTAAGATQEGSITIRIPVTLAGDVYQEAVTLEPGQSVSVPYGTVVEMEQAARLPMVLDHFTADGKALRADYYTATGNCTLGGAFIRLEQGTISFEDSPVYHMGMSKNGTALNSFGAATAVTDYPVRNGDTVFQNDVLEYKGVIRKGASPSDKELEYDGNFTYTFTYPEGTLPQLSSTNNLVTTQQTSHKVSAAIGKGSGGSNHVLKVSAEAKTRTKNWEALADTGWCDTDNLKKTYTLKTAAQLAGLAVLVNGGESFKGVKIKLGNSISLKNPDGSGAVRYWAPIGNTVRNAFSGTFDGNKYSVTGMSAVSSGGTAALFGYCSGAVIKNLTVSGTASSIGFTAGIAANFSGGKIIGCLNNVTVSSTGAKAGGIAAEVKSKGKIVSCRNKGEITATDKAGGITGATDDSGTLISKCANYARITGTGTGNGSCTGGICGYLGGKVNLCANFGPVETGNIYAGGIAGHTWANTKDDNNDSSEIINSMNWANVSTTGATGAASAGGMIGFGRYIIMNNCYSTGGVSIGYTGSKAHKGLLIGYFDKSIYNKITNVYYSGSGDSIICRDTKDSSLDGLDISKQGALSYVSVKKQTEAQMKQPAFADLLNKQAKNAFTAVENSCPQMTWLTGIEEYTVRFEGAYEGEVKTWYNGVVELPQAEEGYVYSFRVKGQSEEWTGTNIRKDTTVEVTKSEAGTCDVIFMADGTRVATIPFKPTDKYIRQAAPEAESVAHKEGYTASWQAKDLADYWNTGRTEALGYSDITVNAVYSQNQLDFERTEDSSGAIRSEAEITAKMAAANKYYYLKPEARGTVTVDPGVRVTLDGSNGPFTNLRIIVCQGASLTLHNVHIMTDPADLAQAGARAGALELDGGSTASKAAEILLSGSSSIYGNNDGYGVDVFGRKTTDIEYPAVLVKGYGRIGAASSDSDRIHIRAYKDNPEVYISNKATLEIAGGIVEVYKYDRLGAQGGMIYGTDYDYDTRGARGSQSGNLTVSGGSLIAVSDTNNVFAFCVNRYKQTGGQVICYATEAETISKYIDKGGSGLDRAVYATKMDIKGGSLRAASRTHKDNKKDKVKRYYNERAIRCGPGSGNRLAKKQFCYALNTSGWKGKKHTVTADGKKIYRGSGNNVGYAYDTGDTFITKISKLSKAEKRVYLWIPRNGRTHTIKVDGKVVDRVKEPKLK